MNRRRWRLARCKLGKLRPGGHAARRMANLSVWYFLGAFDRFWPDRDVEIPWPPNPTPETSR